MGGQTKGVRGAETDQITGAQATMSKQKRRGRAKKSKSLRSFPARARTDKNWNLVLLALCFLFSGANNPPQKKRQQNLNPMFRVCPAGPKQYTTNWRTALLPASSPGAAPEKLFRKLPGSLSSGFGEAKVAVFRTLPGSLSAAWNPCNHSRLGRKVLFCRLSAQERPRSGSGEAKVAVTHRTQVSLQFEKLSRLTRENFNICMQRRPRRRSKLIGPDLFLGLSRRGPRCRMSGQPARRGSASRATRARMASTQCYSVIGLC